MFCWLFATAAADDLWNSLSVDRIRSTDCDRGWYFLLRLLLELLLQLLFGGGNGALLFTRLCCSFCCCWWSFSLFCCFRSLQLLFLCCFWCDCWSSFLFGATGDDDDEDDVDELLAWIMNFDSSAEVWLSEWSDSPPPSMHMILETGELSIFRRAIVECWIPSRSLRCRRSKVGACVVVCSESVDIRSGSLSNPSSNDRVGLKIGFDTSIFVCSISFSFGFALSGIILFLVFVVCLGTFFTAANPKLTLNSLLFDSIERRDVAENLSYDFYLLLYK